jgi:hypothetical protein
MAFMAICVFMNVISFGVPLSIPTVWWIIASGATVNFDSCARSTFLPTVLWRKLV